MWVGMAWPETGPPRRGQKGVQKAYSTRYSQAVSHPSTNQARPCLASEIRRDRARSGWYGRRRGRPSPTSPKSLLRSLSRPPGPPGPPPPHARRPASPEPRAPSPQPRAQTTESPHLRKLPARRRVPPSARPSALPEPHPHACLPRVAYSLPSPPQPALDGARAQPVSASLSPRRMRRGLSSSPPLLPSRTERLFLPQAQYNSALTHPPGISSCPGGGRGRSFPQLLESRPTRDPPSPCPGQGPSAWEREVN